MKMMKDLTKKNELLVASTQGFAVIYRSYVQPGKEIDYQKAWQVVARYFIQYRGAIGSCLHQSSDGLWIVYSRWPDQKTRDASWPLNDNQGADYPVEIHEAIKTIKNCCIADKKLPDICMEVVNDLLLQ